ncbi:hypothetical protein MEZE111188_01750 [Mesobacillus zeae]
MRRKQSHSSVKKAQPSQETKKVKKECGCGKRKRVNKA